MKKLCLISASVAVISMIVACNKENTLIEEVNSPVKVVATYEQPIMTDGTKVSISEGGSIFSLLWEGTETMSVGNSSESTTVKDDFTTTDSGSSSATFTGASGLPAPKEGYSGETINYIGVVSSFASASVANIRGAIRPEQVYNPLAPTAIAKNAMLIARADNCTIGTLTSLSFKTMNAFMKFSLIKGTPADGASHTYDKMYVKSIVVEPVNEEYIAGRFGVSKTAADWYTAYAEEVTDQVSKSVTLDCTSGATTKGVELSDVAKDFYIAIAFKTYAKGLKITIYVQNDSGDLGKVEGYYSKNTSVNVARNTMLKMATLTVRPADYTEDIICWSENWTGSTTATSGDDSARPSACGSTGTFVYGGGSVTYSESANTVYVRNDTFAGGTAPELMLSSGKTWTISGIPTASGAHLSLTYKSNNTKSSVALSGATNATISGSSKNYTITTGGDATITLVFSSSGNTRIDDVVLKVVD